MNFVVKIGSRVAFFDENSGIIANGFFERIEIEFVLNLNSNCRFIHHF